MLVQGLHVNAFRIIRNDGASRLTWNGEHFFREQLYKGIPIESRGYRIHEYLSKCFIDSSTIDPIQWNIRVGASTIADLWLEKEGTLWSVHKDAEFDQQNGRAHFTFTSSDGDVIKSVDALRYGAINAFIFTPNPIVSSGSKYGQHFSDQGDAMQEALFKELRQVELHASTDNGHLIFSDSMLVLRNLSSPNHPVDHFSQGVSLYDRSKPNFEAVHCIYHIRQMCDYLKDLGYAHLITPVQIDPHAHADGDYSSFTTALHPPALQFGTGGVDDAEDAQVIIHEYIHAVINTAAPKSYYGSERRIVEEAICDYFALRYTELLGNPKDVRVFSWDAHNEFWIGYFSRSHPLNIMDPMCDPSCQREKWLHLFCQISRILGNRSTDILVLEFAHHFVPYWDHVQLADRLLELCELFFEKAQADRLKILLRNEHFRFAELTHIVAGSPFKKIYAPKGRVSLVELKRFQVAELMHLNSSLIHSYDLSGGHILSISAPGPGFYLFRLTHREPYWFRKEELNYILVVY